MWLYMMLLHLLEMMEMPVIVKIYSVEVLSLPEDGEPVPSEEKPESKTDGAEEPEVGKEEGESVDSKEHVEL